MLDLSTPEIQFALQTVREACSLSSQIQSEMTASELRKDDRSPVTVADFAVQALIGKCMGDMFPGDILVAEESAEALRKDDAKDVRKQVLSFVKRFISDATEESILDWIDNGNGKPGNRFWTLDPIDGTKGFMRGEQYAVGLSLVKDYQVEMTVIGCPNLDESCKPDIEGYGSITVAAKGGGAWISSLKENSEFQRLKVSEEKDLSKVCMLRSVEAAHTNTSRTSRFMAKLKNEVQAVHMDSLAKYVALAKGVGDVFFYLLPEKNPDYRMKIWDVTPGYLVIKEAGGQMTDLEGKDIDFSKGLTVADNPGLVMTNGVIHQEILNTLHEVQVGN